MWDAVIGSLVDWYLKNRRDLPWRRTEDPYRIWVSEIMLQQTRVEAVKGYYERFIHELPDVEALAACPEDRLLKLWEGLGYYSRVRNMQRAALQILEEGGVFPKKREELLALPGIGPYTAGAIASIAFGEAEPAVDGNVLRVYARLLAKRENILLSSVRKEAEEVLRKEMREAVTKRGIRAGDITQALIELGALLCLPGEKPGCGECPVKEFCGTCKASLQAVIPLRVKETARKLQPLTVLLIREGSRVAIRKRERRGLLAGLYEFPNIAGHLDRSEVVEYIEGRGLEALRVRELCEAKHLFSHVEWQMRGYEIRIASPTGETEWLFAEGNEIEERYALPSAFSAYAAYLSIRTGKEEK